MAKKEKPDQFEVFTGLDRFTNRFAPVWTAKRVRARVATELFADRVRHYEAATYGRRTSAWAKDYGDVNRVVGKALVPLRTYARDLVRNNSWAAEGQRIVSSSVVSWGIVPKATGKGADRASELWRKWANSTECSNDRRLTFAGIQDLAVSSIVESGEVLIRKRSRRMSDGLAVPLQLEVLESDFLDHMKEAQTSQAGGPIIQGVEFDYLGARAAYWLFEEHPGSARQLGPSRRVPASEILHIFRTERPGQVRGVTWLATSLMPLKDFDDYEDATLMKQRIAACFAAFVTDIDGTGAAMGEEDENDDSIETLEPGHIAYLTPGKDVKIASPPSASDHPSFSATQLRKIAKGIGVPYEELTGDYSQVNFSSMRMSRIAFWAKVYKWRHHMVIPLLCDGVWQWFLEAAEISGKLRGELEVEWTAPPMPMIEPDKEGLAYQRLVRNGVMTLSEVIREQGGDPDAHLQEYAADMKRLDELGIKLDSDVRAVSQAGLTQERAGSGGGGAPKDAGSESEREAEILTLEAVRKILPKGE